VEYAVVHTGALPVGVTIQCAIVRRCVAEVGREGGITYGPMIDWKYR
jgi:tartrate dehydratase alpha subunit/fumarate hydratase class I-like protein